MQHVSQGRFLNPRGPSRHHRLLPAPHPAAASAGFPPGVIGDQGGVPEPPGAEAHSVVDNLDRGEVWLFPPKPNGRGAVGFRMDVGGGQGWSPLDGQVWKGNTECGERREDTHPEIRVVVRGSKARFFTLCLLVL